jgi:NAD(P)-dependent dehydrogenase (short-subunit alcohol dehydrogenase family)
VRPDYYTGRVAEISGAASGIGRALAENLSGRGARLILWIGTRRYSGLRRSPVDELARG